MRQGVHSPTRRTQPPGACDPESQRGPLPAEGRGAGKDSSGYRDARPRACPPNTRAPLVPGPRPSPSLWARPGRPRPPGQEPPTRLKPHLLRGCCSGSSWERVSPRVWAMAPTEPITLVQHKLLSPGRDPTPSSEAFQKTHG